MLKRLTFALLALAGLTASAFARAPTIAPQDYLPATAGLYTDGKIHDFMVSFGSRGDGSALTFAVQSPMKAWSLTGVDAKTFDFELRQGDQYSYDAGARTGSERVELAARRYTTAGTEFDTVPNGTPIHIRRTLTVKPGVPNSTAWLVLGQFHQEDEPGQKSWSPPFEFSFVPGTDRMQAMVRYGDGSPGTTTKYTEVPIWTDTVPVVRGQARVYDVFMIVDPTGAIGRVTVLRDGAILASYRGKVGYTFHKSIYWKDGIYRHGPTPETIQTRVADPFFETGAGVVFPDDGVATQAAIVAPPVAATPLLTLGTIEGPFSDGSFRANVSVTASPSSTVLLTLDGTQSAVSGNAAPITDAAGALSIRVAVLGSGVVKTLAVKVGDQVASLKLKAGNGTVVLAQ